MIEDEDPKTGQRMEKTKENVKGSWKGIEEENFGDMMLKFKYQV